MVRLVKSTRLLLFLIGHETGYDPTKYNRSKLFVVQEAWPDRIVIDCEKRYTLHMLMRSGHASCTTNNLPQKPTHNPALDRMGLRSDEIFFVAFCMGLVKNSRALNISHNTY